MMEIAWGTDSNLNDSQFYDRIEDVEFLSNLLDSSQYGSTPTILLTGLRGVGKTALLKKLKNNFQNDYLVMYMDLSSSNAYQDGKLTREAFMELFYDKLMETCGDANLKVFGKKIEKFFKTHNLSIKDFVNYNGIPVPIPEFENNYKNLANFVMELPQRIYEEFSDKIKGIFIFIDEFQAVKDLGENLNSFLWYIRSYVQSQKNVAYVFSGSMGVKDSLIGDIAGKNGAFGGRMLTVEINPFSFDVVKNYLNEKAPSLNFTEEGFERFYKCTKGIPFYINTFARIISENITLDEEMVINEFEKALPILSAHFINTWAKLTFQEQKILTTLIDAPLKRVEIANSLNITSGALSRPLNKLQDEVLIELDGDKYKIVDSILKTWLKNEYVKKGVFPFRTI